MAETQKTTLGWPVYPPVTEKEADQLLQAETIPIWRLGLDGMLVSANPMALWLWNVIRLSERVLSIPDLLNINVFDLFRRSFARIPIEFAENRDFFTKKSAVIKRILRESKTYSPSPFTSFRDAMWADPQHRFIYEQAANPDEEWEYTIRITHPDILNSTILLEFRTIVNAIQHNGMKIGYIARYRPAGDTIQLSRQIYQRVSGRYGISPYVLSKEQREITTGTTDTFIMNQDTNAAFWDQTALVDTDDFSKKGSRQDEIATSNDPWKALLDLMGMAQQQIAEGEYTMATAIEHQKTGPLLTPAGAVDPSADWSPLLQLIENTRHAAETTGTANHEKTTDSIDHNVIWDEWES